MNNISSISSMIYKAMKEGGRDDLKKLFERGLNIEKSEKIGITNTNILFAIGKEIGKMFVKNNNDVELLEDLWHISYENAVDIGSLGLFSNREIRLIAIGILSVLSKKEGYYKSVKNFIMSISNTIFDWETCDQMGIKVIVNLLIINDKDILSVIDKWSKSDYKWERRLAVVSILSYSRHSNADVEKCFNIIDNLMNDGDKDVKKAVGWALRSISKKHSKYVSDFLQKWIKFESPNTRWIIKEGVKKLPENLKERIEKKLK